MLQLQLALASQNCIFGTVIASTHLVLSSGTQLEPPLTQIRATLRPNDD